MTPFRKAEDNHFSAQMSPRAEMGDFLKPKQNNKQACSERAESKEKKAPLWSEEEDKRVQSF